jgi:hypothetical protein
MCIWKRDAKGNIRPLGTVTRVIWWKQLPWYVLGFLGVFATFFTSIVGTSKSSIRCPVFTGANLTVFTFINLYVNCLCLFPVSDIVQFPARPK